MKSRSLNGLMNTVRHQDLRNQAFEQHMLDTGQWPTEDEIYNVLCPKLRERWTHEEHMKRAGVTVGTGFYTIPEVHDIQKPRRVAAKDN